MVATKSAARLLRVVRSQRQLNIGLFEIFDYLNEGGYRGIIYHVRGEFRGGRFRQCPVRASPVFIQEGHGSHDLYYQDPPLPILPTALRTPQAGWHHKVPPALAHKAGSHVQRNYTGSFRRWQALQGRSDSPKNRILARSCLSGADATIPILS